MTDAVSRLRSLDRNTQERWPVPWRLARDKHYVLSSQGHCWAIGQSAEVADLIVTLRNALPEIVALVETADNLEFSTAHMENYRLVKDKNNVNVEPVGWREFQGALAALTEKLR